MLAASLFVVSSSFVCIFCGKAGLGLLPFVRLVVLVVWLLPNGVDGRGGVVSLAILSIAAHSEYLGKESCGTFSIS